VDFNVIKSNQILNLIPGNIKREKHIRKRESEHQEGSEHQEESEHQKGSEHQEESGKKPYKKQNNIQKMNRRSVSIG